MPITLISVLAVKVDVSNVPPFIKNEVIEREVSSLSLKFRCRHGGSSYAVFASTDNLHCFECGDLSHKRFSCPQSHARNKACCREGK